MSSATALQDGLVVMIIGMGIVFAFLTLMVFAVEIMHVIIEFLNKIFPPEPETDNTQKVKQAASDDEMVAIAIAASKI